MKQKIKLPSASLSHAKLLEKAVHILNSLQPQDTLQTSASPPYIKGEKIAIPFWGELQELIDAYDEAIENSLSRSLVSIELLKDSKLALLKLIGTTKLYIETYYNGNVAALASTGFDLTKIPLPYGELEKPSNFVLLNNNKGGIWVKFKKLPGAKSYIIEYRIKGSELWESISITKASHVFSQLKSCTIYEIRVAGVGAHPSRIFSDILSIAAP
ncbi:fibronectin type III domain-containing protein [Flavobacterium sp. xlx-214]|uniref:fibronectin type III domain-containing protein n=1 Tax=unclassified Flavobacterium TaxID=196869 RepID=UPI0013D49C27|nr:MULTISPECIES: fibronectin type III domain-containing protein [unclassified Flavobacterium]MBA5793287.1 fibronectin type III domain-containing protein [Flavobacterium sp. xlx-221]QMI84148.1 fibronectin type III domain-containing protein [Flavobacterium sp. xlx-214]